MKARWIFSGLFLAVLAMFAWAGQFPVWVDTDTDTLFHGDAGGGTNAISTGGVSGGSGWQVDPSTNPVTAGYNLVQAYNEAVASGPSSTNRAVVLASPGIYQMTNTLAWTNEYVDLRCLSGKRDIHLTGSNIRFTADNIEIAHIDVTGTADTFLYMGDAKTNQVFRSVKGGNWPYSPAWWDEKEFAGEMYDSEVGYRFGSFGTVSGTVSDNTIGDDFGYFGTISGMVSGNTIGDFFGDCGTISGTVSDNTIGDYFGSGTVSGTVSDNTIGEGFGFYGTVSGTVSDNTIGDEFGYEGTVTGTILRNRFLGSYEPPTGSGQYIDCLDENDRLFSLAATHDYSGATLYVADGVASSNPATMGQLDTAVTTLSNRVNKVEDGTNNWNTAYSWGDHRLADRTPHMLTLSGSTGTIARANGSLQAVSNAAPVVIEIEAGAVGIASTINFHLYQSGGATWPSTNVVSYFNDLPATNAANVIFYSPPWSTNWTATTIAIEDIP
jgi:hypothetical protein